ncbi:PREDICTED: uncharacterized protein LOC104709889 [Camelina sativa]|uniref:Uncharacterized protein LOC104709889 n=1 Tax=Camelina sativa TaxID=90675 RepID=A0ABM0TDH0_CAMSA|nr:PREDICTED: uncharacterized protein LOC104709889 [Camelina sativa]
MGFGICFVGLCQNAQRTGSLPGVRVARKNHLINHLLFADDTMFFSKTSPSSCATLMLILKRYEEASEQCINVEKFGITFSSKTPLEVKVRVKQALGITNEGGVGKYLGLPEHFGKRKKDIFTALVDKVRQRVMSLSNWFLTSAGKLILLKMVLSSMPSYAMSCFKLPLSLCKRLQSVLTRFWWDDKPGQKKICWVGWDTLTGAKEEGGLGPPLWKRKHHPTPPMGGGAFWRLGISSGKDLAGLSGMVKTSKFGVLRGCLGRKSQTLIPMGPPTKEKAHWKVKELLYPNSTKWNVEVIRQVIPHHEEEILSLILSDSPKPDKLRWLPERSRNYTTKSGYNLCKCSVVPGASGSFNWSKNVWKVTTSPKLRMFLWKVVRNVIPVGMLLVSRGIGDAGSCKRCGGNKEALHVLGSCLFAKRVWQLAPLVSLPRLDNLSTVKELLVSVGQSLTLPPVGLSIAPLYPWIMWYLWKSRNLLIFENKIWSEIKVVQKAILEARSWQQAALIQPKKQTKRKLVEAVSIHPEACVCFSDAAWNATTKVCGLGWTINNFTSGLIQQGSTSQPFVSSSLVAEALALKTVIMAALAMGVVRLVCNSDCQDLIGLINSGGQTTELDGILDNIQFLSLKFMSIFYCYVPRSENSEADASLLSCNASSLVWRLSVSNL